MDSAGITSLVVVSALLTTVLCQQSSLVVPNPITAGQPYTVYCDASRVQIPEQSVTAISKLQISRNLSANPVDTEVTFYYAIQTPGYPISGSTIPPGRAWNFTYTGGDVTNQGILVNRDTMKIVWEVRDTQCPDAGRYTCSVEYLLSAPNGETRTVFSFIDMTSIAETTAIAMTIEQDVTNRQYSVGDNVTFTCSLKCPNTRSISWQLIVIKDNNVQQTPLPIDAVIVNIPYGPPDVTSGCPVYDLKSTLTVRITNYGEDEAYICIVSDNNSIELERENITITIAAKKSDKATSVSGPDVSMIVGIVIACFVLFSNDHIRLPLLHAL